jgi:hypothetical protein
MKIGDRFVSTASGAVASEFTVTEIPDDSAVRPAISGTWLEQQEAALCQFGWTLNRAKMQWEFWRDGVLMAIATVGYLKSQR